MLRLPRAAVPSDLGTTLPTVFLVFGAAVLAITDAFLLPGGMVAGNGAHVVLNVWLLGTLGLLALAWRTGVQLGRLSPATGAGIVLAGYACVARIYGEFLITLLREPLRAYAVPDTVSLVRAWGLVGWVFGVACVVCASLGELRPPGRRASRPDRARRSPPA